MKHKYFKVRSGIFPDIINVCFSKEAFHGILEDYELSTDFQPLESGLAETHFIQGKKIGIIIVIFNLEDIGEHVADISGIIAHEASHVIDNMAEMIGEDHITNEVRAYFTQFLVENIWRCVLTHRKQHARKQNRKLSKQTSKKARGDEPEVDKHDNGSAGQNSIPKQEDAPDRAQISYWEAIAEADSRVSGSVHPGVPSKNNKLD
jgi:hypothetical protein